jgi:hypothetical protein
MEKRSLAVILVLAITLVGLTSVSPTGAVARGSVAPVTGPSVGPGPSALPVAFATHVAPASNAPLMTFPRTVLVETFTAEWCHFCPGESQALSHIEAVASHGTLAVAELHVCATPTDCGDGYVAADGTATTRGAYYNVCGYPDVFFDGVASTCGFVGGGTVAAIQDIYNDQIANASAIPGNVSISQSASVSSGTVTEQASITSGITGVYHAITYLVEYINKNDSTGHVINDVVRSSLINENVTLTAGQTTVINGAGPLGAGWKIANLSVITFVQQNSTKIVENANMQAVSTLSTGLSSAPSTIDAGSSTTVTVRVANATTGAPIAGAQVSLTSNAGGTLSPTSGVTLGNGTFATTFTAPRVTGTTDILISAQATAAGYVMASGSTTIIVNPVIPPTNPTDVTITPGSQAVTLNWTAPSSGGLGLTYHVYRSTTQSGAYSLVGTSLTTSYVDNALAGGAMFWYRVSAQNFGGFSGNSSAVSASSVTAVSSGLPATVGWWLNIDSVTAGSTTSAAITVYLPDGVYTYTIGSDAYGYLAQTATGSITVAAAPSRLPAAFTPRYAVLQGTVSPADAAVSVDGNSVPVISGTYAVDLVAGSHTLDVSVAGYQSNSTIVVLTPGNTTTVNVALHPDQATTTNSPAASNGDMAGLEVGILIAVVATIGLIAVLLTMSKRKKDAQQKQP